MQVELLVCEEGRWIAEGRELEPNIRKTVEIYCNQILSRILYIYVKKFCHVEPVQKLHPYYDLKICMSEVV
jgi:hypothetical protein